MNDGLQLRQNSSSDKFALFREEFFYFKCHSNVAQKCVEKNFYHQRDFSSDVCWNSSLEIKVQAGREILVLKAFRHLVDYLLLSATVYPTPCPSSSEGVWKKERGRGREHAKGINHNSKYLYTVEQTAKLTLCLCSLPSILIHVCMECSISPHGCKEIGFHIMLMYRYCCHHFCNFISVFKFPKQLNLRHFFSEWTLY